MIKTRRLYYLPGLITLIFLPILIVTKASKEITNRKEYCISLSIWDTVYNKEFNYPIPAKRNYINVNIIGSIDDSLKYELIRNFAKGLEQSKDTSLGLKIIFKKNIKYKSFISTINELLKSEIKTYVPFGDTIFAYYMKRTDNCKECNVPDNWSCLKFIFFHCGTMDHDIVSRKRIERNRIYNTYFPYWLVFLVYLVLVLLAIRKIVKGINYKTVFRFDHLARRNFHTTKQQ